MVDTLSFTRLVYTVCPVPADPYPSSVLENSQPLPCLQVGLSCGSISSPFLPASARLSVVFPASPLSGRILGNVFIFFQFR